MLKQYVRDKTISGFLCHIDRAEVGVEVSYEEIDLDIESLKFGVEYHFFDRVRAFMALPSNAFRAKPREMRHYLALTILLAAASGPAMAGAEERPSACSEDTAFGWLDFWLGSWDVLIEDKLRGRNEIRKILDGCAVTEEWINAEGRRGFSLFYFEPAGRTWKQIWVTDRALGQGGVKEKALVERFPDGGVRFQGEIPLPDGRHYLDRTTLLPLGRDEVRQRIEISTDGGESWQTVFDARYVRTGPSTPDR